MNKAREWGIRCVHEAKMHDRSCFVTLTYATEHLPPGWSLSIRDCQLFMKRLRKRIAPEKVRFFLGGEYGERNGRPHYHALLFGYRPRDLVFFSNNERGEPLWTSNEMSALWSVDGASLGFVTVGDVTFDSAVYCAKYVLKKINVTEHSSEEAKERYERKYVVVTADGEVIDREKEFALMSSKPGIGASFFDKFGAEIVNNDSVIVDGREVKPPRYYDDRARKTFVPHDDNAVILCHCSVCVSKRKRQRYAVLNRKDNTPERLRVKGEIMRLAAAKKEKQL